MNVFVTLCTGTLFCATLNSNKKDNNTAPPKSIEGLWEGKSGNGDLNHSQFFSLNVKPGGILEQLSSSGEVKGTGSWSLCKNIFLAEYEYPAHSNNKFSLVGEFDPAKGKLLGNWGFGESISDGGFWEASQK